MKKLLLVTALTLGLSGTAAANSINGITWDENSALDLTSTSASFFQSLGGVGPTLSGGGIINTINGDFNFACAGCELTFEFGGMTLLPTSSYAGGAIDTAFLDFSAGFVKLYVDKTADYNAVTGTGAGSEGGINQLWLDLVFTPGGTLSATETLASLATPGAGGGTGFLDVIGGDAAAAFDTNTKDDGTGYMADLAFSSTITTFFGLPLNFILPDLLNGNAPTAVFLNTAGTGTITLAGDTVTVPEPGTIALFGLGLLGAGVAARRKTLTA